MVKKIFIGADHRGFELKNFLLQKLLEMHIEVVDCGNITHDSDDDYPDFANKVATQMQGQEGCAGVLICGTGIGMCIASNKYHHIRAMLATSLEKIAEARRHNHINVLCLSADDTKPEMAQRMIECFIRNDFSHEDKHVRRVSKISS
jgi:ribose 5-phosphate isomerase B